MTKAASGLSTVAEYERITSGKQGRFELRHGEIVEMTFPELRHSFVQARLREMISRAAGSQYWVHAEVAFRPLSEHELWGRGRSRRRSQALARF
jgi:Uma2 family endonuclease